MALLGLPALALIGALALACFAKVSGVIFLGSPRSDRAAKATERAGAYAPVLLLAAACVGLGLVPMIGVSLVSGAARELAGPLAVAMPESVVSGASTLVFVALAMILVAIALWSTRQLLLRRRPARREVTWACGFGAVTPRMQYTASSFAAPLIAVFGRMSGVMTDRTPTALHTRAMDLVLDGAALPVWYALRGAALRMRAAQHGRLHVYLLYVMAALLGLLAYLSLAPRQ